MSPLTLRAGGAQLGGYFPPCSSAATLPACTQKEARHHCCAWHLMIAISQRLSSSWRHFQHLVPTRPHRWQNSIHFVTQQQACQRTSPNVQNIASVSNLLVIHWPKHVTWPNSKSRWWTKRWLLDGRVARSHCKWTWIFRKVESMTILKQSNIVFPLVKNYSDPYHMQMPQDV